MCPVLKISVVSPVGGKKLDLTGVGPVHPGNKLFFKGVLSSRVVILI